ncbi:MAG TPA: transglutaminase-like domain-containing protein [Clostridia bacterium]|nr:transglutaminase-like domain-containing protein [Clostridia bacterium]
MNLDLKCLAVDLPEDIKRLEYYGDFDGTLRVINKRLQKNLPIALRKRLELEKEIIKVLPTEYPYSLEAASEILNKELKGFKRSELLELKDQNVADWIYVNGEIRFKNNFFANIVKTQPAFAARLKNPALAQDRKKNFELLNSVISDMKTKGNLTYRIHMRTTLKIKKESERVGEPVKVHLPIPTVGFQAKNVKILSVLPEPAVIAPENYPQRTVCFEGPLLSDQEFLTEYEYENHMVYVDPKPENVEDTQPDFYTQELLPHIMFTPYIRELTAEVLGGEKNPLAKARKIYDFITTKITYSYVRPYLTITNIAEYAAVGLKGDCGVQALLFITMCRCAGVPAKWQSGLYVTPLSVGNHDWAQFYLAPYGWLFADCSFGGSAYRIGEEEHWNFYFGNLDPFRMPANSDFQCEFYPRKKFLRNDPYDNQSGEAEYENRGLSSLEYRTDHILVAMKEI